MREPKNRMKISLDAGKTWGEPFTLEKDEAVYLFVPVKQTTSPPAGSNFRISFKTNDKKR